MATAAITGYSALVAISTDGTTYNNIGEIRDCTLNVEGDAIDATSHDSGGWKEFIAGLKSWSVDGDALYIDVDAGQDAVYAALDGGTLLYIRFRPKTGTGKDNFAGRGIVTSWSLAGPNSDAATAKIKIQGSGSLVKSAQ